MKIKEKEISAAKFCLDGMETYRIADKDENPFALLSFVQGKERTLYVDLHIKFWAGGCHGTPNRALKIFKRWWSETNSVSSLARREVQRQFGQLRRQADLQIAKEKDWCSFSNYVKAGK